MECPPIRTLAIVADDAELAARLSCILSRRGYYLPILDGPRMARPDNQSEAARRNNAIARASVKRVALADLSAEQQAAMASLLPSRSILTISGQDLSRKLQEKPAPSTLAWGRTNIGVGLLKALRNNQLLEFSDDAEVGNTELSGRSHIVVCEAGEPLSEVIAANYAFALDADFVLIPEVDKDTAEEVTEEFYSLYDQQDDQQGQSATVPLLMSCLRRVQRRTRQLAPLRPQSRETACRCTHEHQQT